MGIGLNSVIRDLVRSTMFGKDFDSYVSEIEDFIQLRFGPEVASNTVASEQGKMLIEMFSFALATLSWYGDRQADDTTEKFLFQLQGHACAPPPSRSHVNWATSLALPCHRPSRSRSPSPPRRPLGW